jgi:hypothetical protein
MDNTPQQLLAAVKKILAELQSLNNNLQRYSEAIDNSSDSDKQNINITPEVRAVLDLPESEQARKKTSDEGQKRYQKRNLLIGWLTLFALIGYAIVTGFIYLATNKAANAAKDSANAATEAANIAQKQLEVTERPWVAVVVEPVGRITWNDGGLQYSFKITCKNIGKTPAFDVMHFESTTLKRPEDVGAAQRDLAKGFSINEPSDGADNIMPGDDRQTIVQYQVSRKDIEDAIAYSNQKWPKAPALITPSLIGVVYYRSSLDKERHQTGFIYEVGFWDPAKGITVTALDQRSDGNIPPDRVRIRHHPYADGRID